MTTATTAVVVLPAFQLGSLGGFLRADFAVDESALGGIIAVFFLASAVTAPVSGRLADRIGARRALLIGMVGSTVTLVGISVSCQTWQLVTLVVVGGVANGLVQPAANLALSDQGQRSRGLIYGIKQSGVPLATLLTGITVPVVALSLGWRWAFVLTAVLASCVGVVVLLTRTVAAPIPDRTRRAGRARIRPLLAIATAACLGIASATSLGAFTVESAVDRGLDVGSAGWLLACGSMAGVCARLAVGWRTDRSRSNPVTLMIVLLTLGTTGYLLLALGAGTAAIVIGVVVAYACGWGWNGLLMYSVVLLQPQAPAAASGIAQVGMSAGAALGPLGFGAIVAGGGGYPLAWTVCAVSAAAAALILVVVRPGVGAALVGQASSDASASATPRPA